MNTRASPRWDASLPSCAEWSSILPARSKIYRGVGESSRPRWPHKPEIAGANPASATKFQIIAKTGALLSTRTLAAAGSEDSLGNHLTCDSHITLAAWWKDTIGTVQKYRDLVPCLAACGVRTRLRR